MKTDFRVSGLGNQVDGDMIIRKKTRRKDKFGGSIMNSVVGMLNLRCP